MAQRHLRWPAFRSVQDITFLQQFQIESAKTRALSWRGFTLDLIKAFNLLPRRVLYHLLIHHGAPPESVRFWFLNLSKMTRRLQVRQNVGPSITMTTGVPEEIEFQFVPCWSSHPHFIGPYSRPPCFPMHMLITGRISQPINVTISRPLFAFNIWWKPFV